MLQTVLVVMVEYSGVLQV